MCSKAGKSLISSPVPCTAPVPADPGINICLSSGMPATKICHPCWSHPCTELSRQSVTEFIPAKISIQASTRDPDRPSDKYYWLVIIIFYCWYAGGCGALQLGFLHSPLENLFDCGVYTGSEVHLYCRLSLKPQILSKSQSKSEPQSRQIPPPKGAAGDVGLTLDSHSTT